MTNNAALYLVLKSPVGLAGAVEIKGLFRSRIIARKECRAPGTYTIIPLEVGKAVRGDINGAEVIDVQDHRELGHVNGG